MTYLFKQEVSMQNAFTLAVFGPEEMPVSL